MKLLLANGTEVRVESWNSGTATVNGNTVPSVSFLVCGETLETVKTLFNDESNLSDMNLYTDAKELVSNLVGYQVRKSIALSEKDDEFIVTLAKTSEVKTIIENLEKLVTALTEKVTSSEKAVSDLASTVSGYGDKIGEYKTKQDEISGAVETLSTANESNLKQIETIVSSMKTIRESNDGISKENSSIVTTLNLLTENLSLIQQAVTETNSFSAEASNKVENLKNALVAQDESISGVVQTLNQTKQVVTDTDTSVQLLKEDSKKIAKDVTDTADNVSKLSEQNNVLDQKLTEQAENIKKVEDNISSNKEEVSTLKDGVNRLDNRVEALEPVKDIRTLSLEDAKQYRITESANALCEYLASHPITSTCHKGVAAQYSITKEKQSYLQSMILMTQMAVANGVEYQPSWNATGEVCTYDWELEELQQLAMEIEAVVRPLVSLQQKIEKEIKSCETMEALVAVVISYNQATVSDSEDTTEKESTVETDTPAAE